MMHSQRSTRIQVFLGEIVPIMCMGLTHVINQEPDLSVCGEANGSPRIMKMVANLTPDLVLLELTFPGSSGLDLIKNLHRQAPLMTILVLSSYDETLYALRSLRAGARGYLSKSITPPLLLEAIRRALHGDIVVSEHLTAQLVQHAVSDEAALNTSWCSDLTDREIEVLNFIGEGLSMTEIADALHLSIKTVETYRSHLIKKLNLDNSRALMRYAIHWMVNQKAV